MQMLLLSWAYDGNRVAVWRNYASAKLPPEVIRGPGTVEPSVHTHVLLDAVAASLEDASPSLKHEIDIMHSQLHAAGSALA